MAVIRCQAKGVWVVGYVGGFVPFLLTNPPSGKLETLESGLFNGEELSQLIDLAIEADLWGSGLRKTLISNECRALLPELTVPADQLKSDLSKLNFVGADDNGDHPLVTWLQVAARSAYVHRAKFKELRLEAQRRLNGPRGGDAAHLETTDNKL